MNLGKLVIFGGLTLTAIGMFIVVVGKMGGFKLPGDFAFGGKTWKVFLPIGTCILISILLTLVSWLIHFFTRK